jgi:protein disulfide-isomerase
MTNVLPPRRPLEADVFSKPEFVAHATRNWVLVKVDSPRKTKLPFHESTQNAKLQREFAVRGFPTIVAVDAQGTRMAEIKGYVRGGPKAFTAALEQQLRR